MKQKRKGAKTVSKYPFQFFERQKQKGKFESSYSENLQTAVTGTKHTVTTSDNKIIHRKLIINSINSFEQELTNRGTGPRGPDGRFAKKQTKTNTTPESPNQKKIRIPAQNHPPLNGKAQSAGEGHS